MTERDKDEAEATGYEVRTYGAVAYVTVTEDVVRAAVKTGERLRNQRELAETGD